MGMSTERTERLLNLVTLLLNSRRPISFPELREMEEFRAYCSHDPRTRDRAFERDKACLVELGVPLRWVPSEGNADEDEKGGYTIDREHYYLPELDLNAGHLALLSIAAAAAAAVDGFPGQKHVLRALDKLGFDVGEPGAAHSSILAHAPLRASADIEVVREHLECLHDALSRRRRVRMVYAGPSSREERLVDPYGLYYRQGVWYLVGYCHLRESERTFHVGRIKELKLAEGPRRGGHFELPASFNLDDHIRRRPWEYPREAPVEVTVRLASRLVPAVPEIFGGRARVESGEETSLVHVPVSYRAPFIAAVLPFGAAAEVIAPQDLRDEIGAVFKSLAALYQGASS